MDFCFAGNLVEAVSVGLADASGNDGIGAAYRGEQHPSGAGRESGCRRQSQQDRKSTRLNSSHGYISYAVFCLKKKKTIATTLSAQLHPRASTLLTLPWIERPL